MTVADAPSRDGTVGGALHWTTRAIQATLVVMVAWLLVGGDLGFAVNAALMFAIAVTPYLAHRRLSHDLNPVLELLIATAAFLHAVGTLGFYQSIPIFDQVAHGVSASVVAGGGYVFVQVLDTHYESVHVPPKLRFVFVVIFATAFGVLWEIMEFSTGLVAAVVGGEPLLAQYGLSDVVLDLVFDVVGALLVATWGTRYFEGVRGPIARRFDGF